VLDVSWGARREAARQARQAAGPGAHALSHMQPAPARSEGDDALGTFDDVDDDVYAARLERWLRVRPG